MEILAIVLTAIVAFVAGGFCGILLTAHWFVDPKSRDQVLALAEKAHPRG